MINDYISFLGAFGSSEVGCWLPTSTCQRRYQRVGDLTFKWIQDISTTFSFSVVFRWIEVDLLISLSGKLQSCKVAMARLPFKLIQYLIHDIISFSGAYRSSEFEVLADHLTLSLKVIICCFQITHSRIYTAQVYSRIIYFIFRCLSL